MSEGIELRVRAPQRGDSERLLGEEEGGFDEEGGVAGASVGHQDSLDWERDHEDDDDDVSGGDLLRDIDSKRKKRNVAEPYYYQSQRKVVIGVLVGLATILLVLLSVMVGYRMGAPDRSSSNAAAEAVKPELEKMARSVLAAMNKSVDPCHDFYRYSCGTWLSTTNLPADKSRYTKSLSKMADDNQITIHSILEDEWPVISTFYRACMDNETLDRLGATPLADGLKRIADINNASALFAELARLHVEDVSVLFYFGSRIDPDQPNINIAALGQAGLGLPDRQYYLGDDEASVALRLKYTEHMQKLFQLTNQTAIQPSNVLRVETQLASIFIPRTDLRDPYKTNTMKTLDQVKEWAALDWDSYFAALKEFSGNHILTQGKINVVTSAYFEQLDQLMATNGVTLADFKAYLTWHLVYQNSGLLSAEFRAEADRWSNILSERAQAPPRWKQCVSATQGMLGFIVGHLFVQRQFPEGSKEAALELVHNLQTTFGNSIGKLEWMDAETKANAGKKLGKISNKIGYPDKWPLYEDAHVEPNKFFDSVASLRRADSRKVLREIGKEVDKSEWYMYPQEVNAYYASQSNEIVFPAGILTNPVFSRSNINALNYGAIGMVIGHEITHGFDDQGSKFDGDGRMSKWWTNTTLEQFEKRAQCVSQFYSKYEPLPGLHVNGNLTNGENIADMGGLKAAFQAFQAAKEKEARTRHITEDLIRETFDGLTNDQLFFVSFAQLWCGKTTDAQLRISVTTDPHSPYEYRVNGPASNSHEFAAAFKCPRGSPMNPEGKCSIW